MMPRWRLSNWSRIEFSKKLLGFQATFFVNNQCMKKKDALTIDMIRAKIDELVGKNIIMQVCRGRKQIRHYNGIIENAFSKVFVVKLRERDGAVDSLAYSYSDILCGEVVVNESN